VTAHNAAVLVIGTEVLSGKVVDENGPFLARRLHELGSIIGLFWRPPVGESWPEDVIDLVRQREQARNSKDWKRSDEIRNELAAKGVLVEDSAQGQKLRRK